MSEAEEQKQEETTAGSEKTTVAPEKKRRLNSFKTTKGSKKKRAKAVEAKPARLFPALSLEEALQIPTVIKTYNAGNPWPPAEVAKALKMGAKGDRIYYLTASARDYGLTLGSRDTKTIELTAIGRSVVYATSQEVERDSLKRAFSSVESFKAVYEYYKGGSLPELKYLSNTLEGVFKIPPLLHSDFYSLYTQNCRFLEQSGVESGSGISNSVTTTGSQHSIVVGEPKAKTAKVVFVIMPFTEKTGVYKNGFFNEVLNQLITPAAVAAGFKVETAKREGSDVIQSTIVNELLDADLVIADLTDHNPNVLFELGLRMAFDRPTALIRAKGTTAIFDVDNMLRVFDYDPNLWKSTIEVDIPKLTSHVSGTWDTRETAATYMKLLKRS